MHHISAASLLILFSIACSTSSDSAKGIDARPNCTTGTTAEALIPCVETARLTRDVVTAAIERVPGSAGWQSVQDLCASRLQEFGYEVERMNYGSGTNVVGRRLGNAGAPKEVIVSAHYDHIASCPGADDNATGLAATLEIARILSTFESSNTLVIACWDEEEAGLIGSRAYADAAVETSATIAAVFSFDGIGYVSTEPNSQTIPAGFETLFPTQVAEIEAREFRGDYISIIADEASASIADAFAQYGESVGLVTSVLAVPESLKLIPQTADLRRSDHASFWVHDYPGIMVTDSANFRNPNYHCLGGTDTPETLDYGFVTEVTQATLGAVIAALGGDPN